MTELLLDTETGGITGTADKDYNIIWFTETCLSNALRLEIYAKDAERAGDTELAEFDRVMRTHAYGGFHLAKLCIPHMTDADRGDVVMISSVATVSFSFTTGTAPMTNSWSSVR